VILTHSPRLGWLWPTFYSAYTVLCHSVGDVLMMLIQKLIKANTSTGNWFCQDSEVNDIHNPTVTDYAHKNSEAELGIDTTVIGIIGWWLLKS